MAAWFRPANSTKSLRFVPVGIKGWSLFILIMGLFLFGGFMVFTLVKPDEFPEMLANPKLGVSLMFLATILAFYSALYKTDYTL